MWRQTFKQLLKPFKRFSDEKRGSVAIYASLVTALALGGGVLAVDLGKLEAVRNEMQNAVDSAALSAALKLNGLASARVKADAVAREAIEDYSNLTTDRISLSDDASTTDIDESDGDKYFFVKLGNGMNGGVRFWTSIENKIDANLMDDLDDPTEDATTLYVEVILQREPVTLILQPVLALISNATARELVSVNARATATSAGFVCEPALFMVCDPNEDPTLWTDGTEYNIFDWENAGREMVVKNASGGAAGAPGQFGLICPPEDSGFGCGASALANFIMSNSGDQCTNTDVETAPGNSVNQVRDAVNTRFDVEPLTGNHPDWYTASNIINYTDDTDIDEVTAERQMLTNASWSTAGDVVDYWLAKHPNWHILNRLDPDTGVANPDNDAADNDPVLLVDADQNDPDLNFNHVPDVLEAYGGLLGYSGAGATRYQTYLYELGLTFLASGQVTVFPTTGLYDPDTDTIEETESNGGPLPNLPTGGSAWDAYTNPNGQMLPCEADLAAGRRDGSDNMSFTGAVCAEPAGVEEMPEYDGRPTPNRSEIADPIAAALRRVVLMAVLECESQSVQGKGTYNSHGKYVQVFLVHHIDEVGAGDDQSAVGELIGPVVVGEGGGSGSIASNAGVHTNVRLVE